MEEEKPFYTIIRTSSKLDNDKSGLYVNEVMYRGIISSLLYLTISKLDIMFCLGTYAMFQSCPKKSYLKGAKRILRYLKGTLKLVIFYLFGGNFVLVGYIDTGM